MPVMERAKIALLPELMNLPTVEYPPEVTARWDKEVEAAEAQLAMGIKLETLEEYAARRGIVLDG
jgi:hypothetical protein